MQRPELLAPAGNPEALRAAARFGADAVYVGGPLMQLRAKSAGFNRDELTSAAKYLHALGKKLYVTVNCFATNGEIEMLAHYAEFLLCAGVDAAIVSDLGAIRAIKRAAPKLEVHVSTQANCQNYESARAYYEMGASRIVLARELSLDAIAELRAKTPQQLELEAFVHGAMCMAYSGRCILSSFLASRSGNRGECAQPCRWQYHLLEMKRPNEFFPLEQSENGLAILSSRDLCCVGFLDKLASAGISSYKIEGRMKSEYYVASVANAYRHAIDGTAPLDALERELAAVSHRPYCSGFYFGPIEDYPLESSAYIHECTFAAAALEDAADGSVKVEQRDYFKLGDTLEVVRPSHIGESFTLTELRDENGLPRNAANHPKEVLYINCPLPLQAGDMLRTRASKEEK